MAQVTSGKRIQ